MPVNDLNLSIRNPILIYSFLALYGLLTVLVLTYVHAKFRFAAKALKTIQNEWMNAESSHTNFVGMAQQHLEKLSVPPAPAIAVSASRNASVGFDLRNQVVTMAKRGIAIADIGRNVGLNEGEVEVLLGMARLTRGN